MYQASAETWYRLIWHIYTYSSEFNPFTQLNGSHLRKDLLVSGLENPLNFLPLLHCIRIRTRGGIYYETRLSQKEKICQTLLLRNRKSQLVNPLSLVADIWQLLIYLIFFKVLVFHFFDKNLLISSFGHFLSTPSTNIFVLFVLLNGVINGFDLLAVYLQKKILKLFWLAELFSSYFFLFLW